MGRMVRETLLITDYYLTSKLRARTVWIRKEIKEENYWELWVDDITP